MKSALIYTLIRQFIFFVLFSLFPLIGLSNLSIKLSIDGINDQALQNVKNRLTLQQEKDSSELDVTRLQRLYEQGPQEIQEALEPFGYYHAVITPSFKKTQTGYNIRYQIEPGPLTVVQQITLSLLGEGAADLDLQQLFDRFPFKSGNVFIQIDYDAFKKEVANLANEHGLFDARFTTHKVSLDTKANTAKIDLVFDTGKQYYFGDIQFIQQDETFALSFLDRFVSFREGDLYRQTAVVELEKALNNNENFSSIDVVSRISQAEEEHVPIDILITPRKPFAFNIGGGYGTDTGLRSTLGWQWRHLTSTGHQLNNIYRLSEYKNSAEFSYMIPGRDPVTDQLLFSTGYVDDRPPDRDLNSKTAQVNASYLQGDPLKDWKRTWTLSYQDELYKDLDSSNRSTLYMPSITWEMIRTNNRFNARHGYNVRVNLRGASNDTGSSTSFIQGDIFGKWIQDFDNDNYRVLLRGEFGASKLDSLYALPPSLRFYAGGDNSVRGYGFQSLGYTTVNDEGKEVVEGGSYLIVGSAEIERKIIGKWSLAAFYDVGNAIIRLNDPLKEGVGLGIRWQSPIGPVRVDVARALSEPGWPYRLHVNIGPDL